MSIPELLSIARDKLNRGCGDEALSIVMEVIRATKGDEAVMATLDSMKQRLQDKELQSNIDRMCNKLEEDLYIDDECILEADRLCQHLEQQDTLLLEKGREDILRDAFQDGSSIVCVNCGDLIARNRWKQHKDMWCSALSLSEDMDLDSD